MYSNILSDGRSSISAYTAYTDTKQWQCEEPRVPTLYSQGTQFTFAGALYTHPPQVLNLAVILKYSILQDLLMQISLFPGF